MKITDKCGACGQCVEICPVKAIGYSAEKKGNGYQSPEINTEKCIECGDCWNLCPMDAIAEGV